MTHDEALALVLGALSTVAPELNATGIDPDVSLRSGADLDSMDFLSYVAALSDAIDSDISESAYEKIDTVNGAVEFLTTQFQ